MHYTDPLRLTLLVVIAFSLLSLSIERLVSFHESNFPNALKQRKYHGGFGESKTTSSANKSDDEMGLKVELSISNSDGVRGFDEQLLRDIGNGDLTAAYTVISEK